MANVLRIQKATRILGKDQGYTPLPIRDEVTEDGVEYMLSAWELTPEEIAAIHMGQPLMLRILGSSHPPVAIYVGDFTTESQSAEN